MGAKGMGFSGLVFWTRADGEVGVLARLKDSCRELISKCKEN